MTEEEAFIRAICDDPYNDLPKLVYADWLDECGEGQKAELIRGNVAVSRGKQCHTNRRHPTCKHCRLKREVDKIRASWHNPDLKRPSEFGTTKFDTDGVFYHSVRIDLYRWYGRPNCFNCGASGLVDCRDCHGSGYVLGVSAVTGKEIQRFCPNCSGPEEKAVCRECEGRWGGTAYGPRIVRGHPITHVQFTDRYPRPMESSLSQLAIGVKPDAFAWYSEAKMRHHRTSLTHTLPQPILDRIPLRPDADGDELAGNVRKFPTEQAAWRASSEAVTGWARGFKTCVECRRLRPNVRKETEGWVCYDCRPVAA